MLESNKMGRYYHGDIQGKFWFGVQSSSDASHFGVEPTQMYTFYGCGCSCELSSNESSSNESSSIHSSVYCENCYDSYEDHLRETSDERDSEQVYQEDSEICYDFKKSDIDSVKKELKKLEKYSTFLTVFKIIESVELTYDCEVNSVKPPTEKQLPFVARLCLGKLILHCLESKDNCTFYCEL